MSRYAWTPSDEVIARARLTSFLKLAGVPTVSELCDRSTQDVRWFAELVLRFLGIEFRRPPTELLDLSGGIEWPRWCVGASMNIVDSCLRHEGIAVVAEREDGCTEQLTYAEVRGRVARLASVLQVRGIRRGDRVGVYLPMRADTVIALLALAWIGAIAVPLFSGYGPSALAARVAQTSAAALITCGEAVHGGKRLTMLDTGRAGVERCAALCKLIVLPTAGTSEPHAEPVAMDAEDPLIIIFSSGTTGEPKGIVHSHCSFPVKAAQDMALQMDIRAGDRISWITDLGWMMGPWLIYGGLILGGTVVLREGAVDWPAPHALWEFADRTRLDVMGVSPSLVRRLQQYGKPNVPLRALRFFASSGEPWDPVSWQWLFEGVRTEPVPIINYSGGTEISGGILANHPLAPIVPCGFAGPCPGIAADILDESGSSMSTGVGELAIRAPWIGQARGFWNDPDRYLESYWSRVPGTWVHGDWAERKPDGDWFIHGRSDDTLKIAGKRLGPAEVEAIACTHPGVVEAAAIGVPHAEKGTALVVFCVGSADAAEVCDHITRELGKPLRPERVEMVPALPKTRNGKIVRRAIRAAYLNADAGDLSALDNPDAISAMHR